MQNNAPQPTLVFALGLLVRCTLAKYLLALTLSRTYPLSTHYHIVPTHFSSAFPYAKPNYSRVQIVKIMCIYLPPNQISL